MVRANTPNDMWTEDKPATHTFGEIGSEILVQLVKVCFGDDKGIQRRVIGALVRRTLWLERAVLIAGDPGVGGRGWGGRCAGGARRPLHGVHSAYAVERRREAGVSGCEQEGGTDEATVLGQHALRRQSASQYLVMILLTSARDFLYTDWKTCFWVQTNTVQQCKQWYNRTAQSPSRAANFGSIYRKSRETVLFLPLLGLGNSGRCLGVG